MRMATSERWKDRNGDRQERTEWHTVVLFGKRAEALVQFLGKGDRIYVEGSLQTRTWEDKDGAKRYSTEVKARDIKFQNPPRDRGHAQHRTERAPKSYGASGTQAALADDDIPF